MRNGCGKTKPISLGDFASFKSAATCSIAHSSSTPGSLFSGLLIRLEIGLAVISLGIRLCIWATNSSGCAGDDYTTSPPLFGISILPAVPKARENEGGSIFHFDRIRNFPFGRFLPFVKAVGRNQASTLVKRAAKGWGRIDPFCPGIDKARFAMRSPALSSPGTSKTLL
jgi:hypothetical protein